MTSESFELLVTLGGALAATLAIHHGFTKPSLVEAKKKANARFKALNAPNRDPRYSFCGQTAQILVKDDSESCESFIASVSLYRICKNEHGEYFLVQEFNWKPMITHLDVRRAKNALRPYAAAYYREFREKPYV